LKPRLTYVLVAVITRKNNEKHLIYFGISTNFIKVFRTNGKTIRINGNAINHDRLHACSQIEKKPSTQPSLRKRLKQEIAPLIMPDKMSGMSHVMCLG